MLVSSIPHFSLISSLIVSIWWKVDKLLESVLHNKTTLGSDSGRLLARIGLASARAERTFIFADVDTSISGFDI